MPRPFAVIGITAFLTLAALYNVSGETAVVFLAVFTIALLVSMFIGPLRRQRVFPVAFASAAVACLMLVCINEFVYYPQLELAGNIHTVSCRITSEMEQKNGKFYCEAVADEIDGEDSSVRLRLVFVTAPEINAYDSIDGKFTFYELGSSSEDALSSFKSENRFLGAYTADGNYNIVRNTDRIKPVGYYVLHFRSAVSRAIMRMLPNDYGALCTALVLGDRSRLSDSAYASLRSCGITHIICVSGLHISIWSSAILWLLKKLRIREKIACAIAVPAVVLLMLVEGMTYSVIRAGIMMLIYLLSVILSRRRDSLNSLGLALTGIIAFNPFSAGDIGFELSALATLGIILYSEYCNPGVTAFFRKHTALFPAEKPVKLLLVSCAAMAFCLPVTTSAFGNFNFCVFPANILVVGAAEVCMICTVPGAVISALAPGLFNLPGFTAGILAKYIIKLTGLMSGLGFLNIRLSGTDSNMLICGLSAFCALSLLIAYTGKKVMPSSAILAASLVVFSVIFFGIRDYNTTRIRVFDSGNSTSVLVSYKGENVLIGCGGENYNSASQIGYAIDDYGGNLSAVFIPENNSLFTKCFYKVVTQYPPENIYCPSDMLTAGLSSETDIHENNGSVTIGKITIDYSENGDIYVIKNKDVTAAVCCMPGEMTAETEEIRNADVFITRSAMPDTYEFDNISLVVAESDNETGLVLQSELAAEGLNVAVTAENGDILITADNGYIAAERM